MAFVLRNNNGFKTSLPLAILPSLTLFYLIFYKDFIKICYNLRFYPFHPSFIIPKFLNPLIEEIEDTGLLVLYSNYQMYYKYPLYKLQ